MINSDKYFTIIYRDLTVDERRRLLDNPKWSASGYSHAFDDRDGLLSALAYLEDFLTELTSQFLWAPPSVITKKIQKEIADIQKLMKMHGRLPKNHLNTVENTMESKHPIVPPPELVGEWAQSSTESSNGAFWRHLATKGAQWGADQELEACCDWLRNNGLFETRIGHLRDARRPKVPTLKEKVLDILGNHGGLSPEEHSRITQVLEDSLRD